MLPAVSCAPTLASKARARSQKLPSSSKGFRPASDGQRGAQKDPGAQSIQKGSSLSCGSRLNIKRFQLPKARHLGIVRRSQQEPQ
eukprot:649679-Alexandrium_andersonii.AAC.1